MANVKIRLNARRSASAKYNDKGKISTGIQNHIEPLETEYLRSNRRKKTIDNGMSTAATKALKSIKPGNNKKKASNRLISEINKSINMKKTIESITIEDTKKTRSEKESVIKRSTNLNHKDNEKTELKTVKHKRSNRNKRNGKSTHDIEINNSVDSTELDVITKEESKPMNILSTQKTKIQYFNHSNLAKDIGSRGEEELLTNYELMNTKCKSNMKLIGDHFPKNKSIIEVDSNKRRISQKNHACKKGVNNNNDNAMTDHNKTDVEIIKKSKKYLIVTNGRRVKSKSKSRRNNISSTKANKNRKNSVLSLDEITNNSINGSNMNTTDSIVSINDKGLSANFIEFSNSIAVNNETEVEVNTRIVLESTYYQCDYCQRRFRCKSSLVRHMHLHLDIKPHTCSFCLRKFRQLFNLRLHIRHVHAEIEKEDKFFCTKCEKPFSLKNILPQFMTSTKGKYKSYKCAHCNKMYSPSLLLINYNREKKLGTTGNYQCDICKSKYDCRSRLSRHLKSHQKTKECMCDYCGKEFLNATSVKRHIDICHGHVKIQCPICKKYLKGHLTEHMRLHEKKRPHKCPDCGQSFTQSTQLTVHRRSHTGARPYPCKICNRAFTHSNALMLHLRRHTGEKPFSCAMCPLTFSQLPHMKAHMLKIHGKKKPYKCKMCDQFFKWKSDVEGHERICGVKELSFEEQIQASVYTDEMEKVYSGMTISRMRFLLALLLTMIATEDKLKYLGFNKRLIDDLLIESLEAMGHTPCKDESQSPLKRLKANIEMLLKGTIPDGQMEIFRKENKSTEEILEILTEEKNW